MRVSGISKSATAFRTISEVSTDLEVPQHVLRFWEGKFPQIRPLKRGGGRRYYRPEDVDLLRRIQSLLYREGYTIRGAQRLLQDDRPGVDPQHFPPATDLDLPDDAGEGADEDADVADSNTADHEAAGIGSASDAKATASSASIISPADIHDLDIAPVLSARPMPSSDRLDPIHRQFLTELLEELKEVQDLVGKAAAKK